MCSRMNRGRKANKWGGAGEKEREIVRLEDGLIDGLMIQYSFRESEKMPKRLGELNPGGDWRERRERKLNSRLVRRSGMWRAERHGKRVNHTAPTRRGE